MEVHVEMTETWPCRILLHLIFCVWVMGIDEKCHLCYGVSTLEMEIHIGKRRSGNYFSQRLQNPKVYTYIFSNTLEEAMKIQCESFPFWIDLNLYLTIWIDWCSLDYEIVSITPKPYRKFYVNELVRNFMKITWNQKKSAFNHPFLVLHIKNLGSG